MLLNVEVELNPDLKSKLVNHGFTSTPITIIEMVPVGSSRYEVQIDQATHGIVFNKKAVDKFNSFDTGYKNPLVETEHPRSFIRQKFKTLEQAQLVFDACTKWVKDSDYYQLVKGLA